LKTLRQGDQVSGGSDVGADGRVQHAVGVIVAGGGGRR